MILYGKVGKNKKNMKCIIIGNGPSLNNIDLQKLKDVDTFAVNKSYMDYKDWDFYPTYYSIIDFWTLRTIKPELINFIKKDSNIKKFFIAEYTKEKFGELNSTEGDFDFDERVCYLKEKYGVVHCPFGQWVDKIPKYANNISFVPSIVPITIQLAISLGYTEIGLVGVDVRYVKRPDVVKFTENGETKTKFTSDNDPNHYRKDYHGEGHLTGDMHLNSVAGNDLSPYTILAKYAKEVNVKVYSCTENSRANGTFPYKDYIEFIK